jgi:hypothetical protein
VTNTSVIALAATFSATLPAGLRVSLPTTTLPGGQPCTLTNAGQRATCALGTLAVGQSVTITITATLLSAPLGANLCAIGQVNASAVGQPVTSQAQACTRVGPPPLPDLVTALACTPAAPALTQAAMCTLTVTNMGDRAATLPGGMVLGAMVVTQQTGVSTPITFGDNSAMPGYPECVPFGPAYQCSVPSGGDTLAVGASRTWQLRYVNHCTNCAAGTLTVIGRADPAGVIAETRKANNDSLPTTLAFAP